MHEELPRWWRHSRCGSFPLGAGTPHMTVELPMWRRCSPCSRGTPHVAEALPMQWRCYLLQRRCSPSGGDARNVTVALPVQWRHSPCGESTPCVAEALPKWQTLPVWWRQLRTVKELCLYVHEIFFNFCQLSIRLQNLPSTFCTSMGSSVNFRHVSEHSQKIPSISDNFP